MNWIFRHPFQAMACGFKRSSEIVHAQAAWTKAHPNCAWCGALKPEAHHIVPFHIDPAKGADPTNFISLCRARGCHCLVGHMGVFATGINPNVRATCATSPVGEKP